MRRWLILSGAALIFVALGIVWILQPSREDSTAQYSDGSPAMLMWRVGSAQKYLVQFDSSMMMNPAGTSGAQAMRVQMNGMLDMHTLEIDGDKALVGMQLTAIDLHVNGNTDPGTNEALTAPFRVYYVSGGIPEAFEFPADVAAQHRGMLENLVRTFQVTMGKGETWVAQESNAQGAYEAVYQRTAPRRVEKIKTNFSGSASTKMFAGAEIVSSEAFQLDPQRDWIAAMSIDESLRPKGQGGSFAMEITNFAKLELQPGESAVASDTWLFVATAAPPVTKEKKPNPSISPQQAHQQILALLPELDTAIEGRSTLIHRLRDLLRVNASMPANLLEQMKTQQFSDRTSADLYLALELAGTESAQAALVSVIEDTEWSTRDSMRAIVALAGVAQPSSDTLEVLWNTAESVPSNENRQQLVSTATLALGSLGGTMNATNNPDYPALRDRLLRGAITSTGSDFNDNQRKNYVHAMGNTSDVSLASDVVLFLDDDEPAVRHSAALSLGRLGADQVADDLMARFNREKSSEVRGAIAESLVKWTTPSASAMASVGAAVRAEPDETTRYNMARFMGANLETYPQNREILKDLLRTEQSKRIRQSIAEALATSSNSNIGRTQQ